MPNETYPAPDRAVSARVADGIDSALERISNATKRIRDIEDRVTHIISRVHGPSPKEIPKGIGPGDPAPPLSLHYFLQQLEAALDSCQGELGRL